MPQRVRTLDSLHEAVSSDLSDFYNDWKIGRRNEGKGLMSCTYFHCTSWSSTTPHSIR